MPDRPSANRRTACLSFGQDAEKAALLTRQTPARRDAPFLMRRSRIVQILNGDPAPHHSAARTDLVLLIRRTVRPRGHASGLHSLRPC